MVSVVSEDSFWTVHINLSALRTRRLTKNFFHGKEAVMTEQQLASLAKGAQIQGAQQSQDALAGALNTLNKQTAQLIAINAQQAALQQRLVEKFEWQGNLFS